VQLGESRPSLPAPLSTATRLFGEQANRRGGNTLNNFNAVVTAQLASRV